MQVSASGVSARGCLGQEREATLTPLLMIGVCLVQLSSHVGGFRESSFLAKQRFCFGNSKSLPSLRVLCKKAYFLCFLITHSLKQTKEHSTD